MHLPVAVYAPRDPRPHPVVIALGGGPARQFRPVFDPWIQYLVNELGYAVVEPTLRGSAGYGKTFRSLDGGNLREDAVKDIGALLVWLGSQSDLDARSVVVAGSGHGGYLALAALINYGDRLRGGVDFGGMTDFVGDERDPEARAFLRRISPLTGAERISKPLLVVHGRNDPFVPLDQSQQLVNRLRSRGLAVWYLTAEDEGAEFRQKSDRDAFLRIFAQFLTTVR
jgi:dipeptidyl aminopeptidase/acylaminoacyl peptidase